METELTESEELLKKDSLLSAEVKTQLQHMTDALDRLVQKEADLTKLNEAIRKSRRFQLTMKQIIQLTAGKLTQMH